MSFRATMEVGGRGNDQGWTLSFLTWTTLDDRSLNGQPLAEIERLTAFGVDYSRHRITRYDYPEIQAQSVAGFNGYDLTQQEMDRINRTIGRVVRFWFTTSGGVIEWPKVAVLAAAPRFQAGTIAGDTAATFMVETRWTLRRLPDNA